MTTTKIDPIIEKLYTRLDQYKRATHKRNKDRFLLSDLRSKHKKQKQILNGYKGGIKSLKELNKKRRNALLEITSLFEDYEIDLNITEIEVLGKVEEIVKNAI